MPPFPCNADCAKAEFPADIDQHPPDGGVQMHVLVGIGMIQRQAGVGESLELRTNFRRQLPADTGTKIIVDPQPQLIRRELTVRIDQIGDRGMRQNGWPLDRHEMQPDLQSGQVARPTDGIGGGGRGDHQARLSQHAVAMRPFHRLVHRFGQPEIVRRKDDACGQMAIA